MNKETMTAEEMAELMHCTVRQVEQLTRDGDLPAVKIGRSWLYVRADVLAFLSEEGRRNAAELKSKKTPASVTPLVPKSVRPRRMIPPALPVPR